MLNPIVKFLPHEVSDLELVLRLLESSDRNDYDTWQARYGLLLWLSIVVLVPFNLKTVDRDESQAEAQIPAVVTRIISLCKLFLGDSGPTRDMAAEVLARLLTRPDLVPTALPLFIRETLEQLSSHSDIFLVYMCYLVVSNNIRVRD